jgi:hypothetical protein
VSGGTALEVVESLTPVMATTAYTMSFFFEPLLHIFQTSIYFESVENLAITVGLISVGALFAFFMVLVEFILISTTSALTFMVAGVFKEIVTVLVAHFTYGDRFTALNGAGLGVLLCGVALFNYQQYVKSLETGRLNPGPCDECVEDGMRLMDFENGGKCGVNGECNASRPFACGSDASMHEIDAEKLKQRLLKDGEVLTTASSMSSECGKRLGAGVS